MIPEKASDGNAPLQWQMILPAIGRERISSQVRMMIPSGVVRNKRLLADTRSDKFANSLEDVNAAALAADSFMVS